MATTDYDEETPSRAEQLAAVFGTAVTKLTDTPGSGLGARTFLLFILLAVCVALAPVPANVIGVVAAIALALSVAGRRRGL